jgi:hypothetical protein
MDNVLACAQSAVWLLVFARHHQNRKGRTSQHIFDDVSDRVPGTLARFISDDVVLMVLVQMIFEVTPLSRSPMTDENLGCGFCLYRWGWCFRERYETPFRFRIEDVR